MRRKYNIYVNEQNIRKCCNNIEFSFKENFTFFEKVVNFESDK